MFFTQYLKNEKVLWVLIIATQLFFFNSSQILQHTKTADSAEYIYLAQNIVDHGVIYCGDYTSEPKDISLYSRRTPGYPVYLLLTKIIFNSDFLPLLLQCMFSIFNIFLGYKIAIQIFSDSSKAYLYLFFFLFFPSQFIYATLFMTEILFQTSVLLCIYFLLIFEKNGRFKFFYIYHLFLAIAYLIKPIALFLWLVYILYGIIFHNNRGIAARQITIALFHLLIIGGFFIKNYHQTGIAEYSGIGRKLLINYNMPALLSSYENEEYAKNRIDSLQFSIINHTYASQCASIDLFIRKEVTSHPLHFIALQVYGAIKFLLETGRWDLELWRKGYQHLDNSKSLKQQFTTNGLTGLQQELKSWNPFFLIYYFLVMIVTFTLFILFIKSLFNTSLLFRHKLLLVSTIIYFALLTGPSASARFRIPIFPILVILAITGIPKRNSQSNFFLSAK
ncbi:MAG: glycosyltransferase family 39 protein [Bacteroidetes bacterium]|nr:glycosyltransferase family 39 protein [Bacteroidota bacterium]